MLVYALVDADDPLDRAARVVVLVVSVPSAIVIFSSIWVVGACIAFWTTDGGEFTNAFTYGGTAMAQYPFDIYATLAAALARVTSSRSRSSATSRRSTCSASPTRSACRASSSSARRPSPRLAALVAGLVWRFAVRHYRSAGG